MKPKKMILATDRSSIMRAVRSQDTKPERLVRKLAWSLRPGYRLHRRDIAGNPDIAYIGPKVAIFVHGCFWHGHDCMRGARIPKTNRDYWLGKIARNKERDAATLKALSDQGWAAEVIWECELKQREEILSRLRQALA